MPHITIEYSANVAEHHDVQALVDALHESAVALDLAALGGYRTRAERTFYRVADGDPAFAFVAITVRIGPGRTPETKSTIITALLDTAEAQIDSVANSLAIAWSCEVQEIDADFRVNRNHVSSTIAARAESRS